MGGGTIQLVATGGQDIFLIGNPAFSFFKSVYRKHTNFSIECIQIGENGNIGSGENKINYEIPRIGDLLSKMHFEIDLPTQTNVTVTGSGAWANYSNTTAFSYLKEIELNIGEKTIDKHDGRWYDILNELTGNGNSNQDGDNLDYLINKSSTWPDEDRTSPQRTQLYIPLKFWFCNDYSLSLPLIALQYHKVDIKATFRDISNIINAKGNFTSTQPILPPTNLKLWGNYIFLDTDERKKMASGSHEYLIEQVQLISNNFNQRINIPFNHPIKCLYWVIQNDNAISAKNDFTNINSALNNTNDNEDAWTNSNDFLNYDTHKRINQSYLHSGTGKYEHFDTMYLSINGIERFTKRKATYFRTIQPYEHGYYFPEKNIYMYSFSLEPNKYEPSGTCNFSQVDNATLIFDGEQSYDGYTIYVYAKNYNILRIMNGFGGLLYSN
tara:strand:+ start:1452 stop:2768 length:1317 start_codon:yes stop_codon:yes gene_type:complete